MSEEEENADVSLEQLAEDALELRALMPWSALTYFRVSR